MVVDVAVVVAAGVVVEVGVVVVAVVVAVAGADVGVARGPDPGVAMIVGNGVTGMLVGSPLGNVGVSVGVGPLFSVLCVVRVLPTMRTPKIIQTSKTTRSTPPPMIAWSSRRWDRYQRQSAR